METNLQSENPGSVQYAGFWLRFAAHFIDQIILSIFSMFFIIPFVVLTGITAGLSDLAGIDMNDLGDEEKLLLVGGVMGFIMMVTLIAVVVSWLYYALMESSYRQGTLGKMALEIKVTDMNGNRLSFVNATGRYFAKILSGLTFGIGYVMAAFTRQKQALHDVIAGCLVVKR